MKKRYFTIVAVVLGVLAAGGVAFAAASSVPTRPAPAFVDNSSRFTSSEPGDDGTSAAPSSESDDPVGHDIGDDRGDGTTTRSATADDDGTESSEVEDLGDDHGVDPMTSSATPTTVDDHGGDDGSGRDGGGDHDGSTGSTSSSGDHSSDG